MAPYHCISRTAAVDMVEAKVTAGLTRSLVLCTANPETLWTLLSRFGDSVRLWTGTTDQHFELLDGAKVFVAPHDFIPNDNPSRAHILNRVHTIPVSL